MKKRIFLSCLALSVIWNVQAQTAATTATPAVECSSKTYFSDNQCEVCYEGGEVTPEASGVKLKEVVMEWENDLDGINQNFYETSQDIAEIKTNIGTPSSPWDETGLEWGADVVWKDIDGLNMLTLNPGKTIQVKIIKADSNITLTSPKQPADPHIVVKIPISYYELKMGTFKESDKKTKNYCVSYTPKKVAGTNATNSNTAGTTSNTNTSSSGTASSNTTSSNTSATNSSTTTNSSSNTSTTSGTNNSTVTDVPEADTGTTNTATEKIDNEIPSYDAKVTLNSAGTDPLASQASHVATGPAENLLFIAAILLSVLMFPKMNQIFNRM